MSEITYAFEDVQIPVLVDEPGGATETLLVLAPSAGGNRRSPILQKVAARMVADGARVARFDFPYRVRGKSMPDRMPVLMRCYTGVIERLREEFKPKTVLIGGHSMGGRTASMIVAEGASVEGLLLLGYPLHPAGQPEKLRDAHLPDIHVPTLCINGDRDDLCTKDLMEAAMPRLDKAFQMRWLTNVDHSLKPVTKARSAAEVDDEYLRMISDWRETL